MYFGAGAKPGGVGQQSQPQAMGGKGGASSSPQQAAAQPAAPGGKGIPQQQLPGALTRGSNLPMPQGGPTLAAPPGTQSSAMDMTALLNQAALASGRGTQLDSLAATIGGKGGEPSPYPPTPTPSRQPQPRGQSLRPYAAPFRNQFQVRR